jgi:ApaG protein
MGVERAVTHGVEVAAEGFFIPEQSDASSGRYTFAYRIQLRNLGECTVQLLSRHWIITDGDGTERHVRGMGVVGEQPALVPGGSYEYMSGSQITHPMGTMHGTYQMQTDAGEPIEVEIPCFTLAVPGVAN